jgi:hypothetical protein
MRRQLIPRAVPILAVPQQFKARLEGSTPWLRSSLTRLFPKFVFKQPGGFRKLRLVDAADDPRHKFIQDETFQQRKPLETQPEKSVVHTLQLNACGRGDRIRTYDLLVPNQALYQAKLHPEKRT